jgi:hypothetical protein
MAEGNGFGKVILDSTNPFCHCEEERRSNLVAICFEYKGDEPILRIGMATRLPRSFLARNDKI